MTEMPNKPTVLLVGSTEHGGSANGHFANVIRWLGVRVNLRRAFSLAEAIQSSAPCDPSLIVVMHTVPGIVPVDVEAQLDVAFPECRVAHLLGPWCEGEMRGLRPMPGKQVIRWHQWKARLEDCLRPTAGSGQESESVRCAPGVIVGIATADHEMGDCWAGILASIGCRTVVMSSCSGADLASVDLVIWDEAKTARSATVGLRSLIQDVAPIPVVAAMSFVRPFDDETARQAGAVGILSKPFSASELSQLIYRHIPGSLPESRAGAPAA